MKTKEKEQRERERSPLCLRSTRERGKQGGKKPKIPFRYAAYERVRENGEGGGRGKCKQNKIIRKKNSLVRCKTDRRWRVSSQSELQRERNKKRAFSKGWTTKKRHKTRRPFPLRNKCKYVALRTGLWIDTTEENTKKERTLEERAKLVTSRSSAPAQNNRRKKQEWSALDKSG
jgi:hypothetical protein